MQANRKGMTVKEFFGKFKSRHLWGNLLAMAAIIFLASLGLKYGLDLYTRHGQSVEMPDIIHKTLDQAEAMLDSLDLDIEVSDTGYVKTLPPDCILEQSIPSGDVIKPDRTVYVKINAAHSPTRAIPDVVDNASMRDAEYRLTSLGFKLGETEYVPGERDWVYGLKCRGKKVNEGDMVSTEDLLILQVGDGRRNMGEVLNYTDPKVDDEGWVDDETEVKRYKPKAKKEEERETKSSEQIGEHTARPEALAPVNKPAAPVPPVTAPAIKP